MKLTEANQIAQGVCNILKSLCVRIEIAGSIRRGKEEPGDIEIVCMPLLVNKNDLFGTVYTVQDYFEAFPFDTLGRVVKNGLKYKKIELSQGINLDLFIVREPAQWGVLYAIRTGPADFSHWLVTAKNMGGALPPRCKIADGQLFEDCTQYWDEKAQRYVLTGGTPVLMPEEKDLFEYLQLPYIEPKDRHAQWGGNK